MSDSENKASALSELLYETMDELLKLRSEFRVWIGKEHMAKDTEACLNQLNDISDEISDIARKIGENKKVLPSDDPQLNADIKMFEITRGYELEILEFLNRDLDAKREIEKERKIDYIKNMTFLFGLPIGFVAGVKNGVGNGHIGTNEALVFGFAISIPTVFHKSAKSVFSKVAKGICAVPATLRAVPAYVGNDIRVLYAKELIKEKTNSAHICLAAATKCINDNAKFTRTQVKTGFRKLLGRGGPRP